jgi:drug/metabolite transporter (DMT)-like permease
MREFILFFLIVVAGTGGEMCISRAMKEVGEVHEFHPAIVARTILRALRIGWMWLGLSMMATAFFALLGALSIESVSFVVSITALSYLAGAAGSRVFLREHVSRERWIGVGLVCLGVTLVLLGKRA